MLVVVDDAWDAESALAFKLGGPNCSHLLTTRIPEVALAFAGSRLTTVSELNQEDSLALLSRLAPDVVEAEPVAVLALVKMTGGLPLALTLVGGHLRRQSHFGRPRRVHEAITHLQTARERLGLAQPQTLLGRHPSLPLGTSLSLLAVIEVSYEVLSPAAREMLLSLSVFPPKPSTFSEEAALAVADAQPEGLDELFDQGLLESTGPDRCALHQTISDYARERTSGRTASDGMVDHFADYVEENTSDYTAIDRELSNILEALRLADGLGRSSELRRMALALFPFLDRRGLYELGETYLRLALDAMGDEAGNEERGHVLYCLGKIIEHRGELETAEGYLKRSHQILDNLPGNRLVADVLIGLGWVAGMRGRLLEAADYFEDAKTAARGMGSPAAEAAALQGLGWSHGLRGDYPASIASLRQGVEMAREVGDPDVTADVLQVLGWMHNMSGDVTEAERSFRDCPTLARKTGRPYRLIDALQGIGVIEARNCRYAAASGYLREATDIAERVGHPERMALLANLGAVRRDMGDFQTAKSHLREGVTLALRAGHQEKISLLLIFLGDVEGRLGEFESARLHLLEGLNVAREFGIHERIIEALENLSRFARISGDPATAEEYLAEGLRLTVDRSDAAYRSRLQLEMGELRLDQRDLGAAEGGFGQAGELARDAGRHELDALSKYGLARVARATGDAPAAERLGRESLSVLREIGYCDAGEVEAWLIRSDE
jgi:tetratricopeptide (TPR) repeat protein